MRLLASTQARTRTTLVTPSAVCCLESWLLARCGVESLQHCPPFAPSREGAARRAFVRRAAVEPLEVEADIERATMPAGSLLPCCRESYTPVNPAHQGRKLMCARWIGYLCGLNLFLLGLDTASQLL